MAVTQRQIAEKLGISTTTISFVLNGQAAEKKINPETIERVRAAAEELGYRASYHARVLNSGKCATLGLALEDRGALSHRFWGPIAHGICTAAQKEEYELMLVMPHKDERAVARGVKFLQEKRIDALICLVETDLNTFDPALPIVCIGDVSPACRYSNVVLNPVPGIRDAVDHLVKLGHHHILRLSMTHDGEDYVPDRGVAFRRAVSAAKIKGSEALIQVEPRYSMRLEDHIGEYRAVLQKTLTVPRGVTAILAYNDTMALALYSVLAERGLKIPDDISVIGFDDLHASHAIPALTTISHMLPELGTQAVEVALASVNTQIPQKAMTRRVASTLVVRQSTGPAR